MKFPVIITSTALSICFTLLLSSCINKNNSEATVPVTIFKPSPLDSVYAGIRPAVQTFSVDNNNVNKIKAANGTEVLIPANCFMMPDGSRAGKVQLEIVEAFSLPQFVASGLITQSNGSLLSSNGMVYINAKSGNENLQLVKGALLTVSMPTITANNGFQLFSGDGSNWVVDSSMLTTNYIIPLPLGLLYPNGNNLFTYCITSVGQKEEKSYLLDTSIVSVSNVKYENTIVATQEFSDRYISLFSMMDYMSFFTDSAYYFDKTDCGGQKFNYDIWKVYFEHPNRSLRESDSIAKKVYVDYFKANKEKITTFCDAVNVHKRQYFSNWTDTNYFFDFRKTSLEDDYMSPLKFFPPTAAKELKLVNTQGVNLNTPEAFQQLLSKGIGRDEINQIMEYNFRREAKIAELRRIKNAIENKRSLEQMYQSTIFSVSQMGWINCDRFYDDPSAGKAVIFATNNYGAKPDYVDFSLVIPEINARLSAFNDSAGRWSFTKKDGRYTRLPIGKNAVITGISLQHDSVFFASQKIKIADGLSANLPLKYINKSNLSDSLVAALKN